VSKVTEENKATAAVDGMALRDGAAGVYAKMNALEITLNSQIKATAAPPVAII
jgi:hypothetical protein